LPSENCVNKISAHRIFQRNNWHQDFWNNGSFHTANLIYDVISLEVILTIRPSEILIKTEKIYEQ